MAKLLYATTHNKKDCPWLIDSEQLLTLDDSLDAHFAKSLAAGATTDGQAGSILANNLQKRIIFSFRHGKQLETDSFREAISHPEVAHEVITGLKYEASIGRTLAVLTLQKANNKGSLPLTDDEVELSIIVEPHGEPLSEQVLTIMRSWSDNIAAPLWHKFLFELRAFWRFILIAWCAIFGVYLISPSPPSFRDYYKQEARKLLEQGVSSNNQQKAIELLVAIQTGTAPSGVQPGRDSKIGAIAINLSALMGISVLASLPGFCIGIGKGKQTLRRWRGWLRLVSGTVAVLLSTHYFYPQLYALIDRAIGTR